MDSLAFHTVQRAEQEELERHLAQVRLARAVRAEHDRLARRDPSPRRRPPRTLRSRISDMLHVPRHPVRTA
ncbi:hypothetical protein ET495_07160 [Xylanimonas allomyrinae]|uniref:Uncharacterized protein n=1 Tax=Xylanimonas allomyrinae TaxID=2509459 RepID=A0A4P6ENY0_9MICO|nr:hypothetical protein [Xylanimonas allomyrinae]QAY63059.1 hypothetical protein ET495_07160 [Xylanimonas allomyrinae]